MNNIYNFLTTNIEFDNLNDINLATRSFNKIGNFFLSPARYLFQGKNVYCILEKYRNVGFVPRFHVDHDYESKGIEKVLKTTVSILLFIPGTMIGAAFKGTCFLASDRLRRRYKHFSSLQTTVPAGNKANPSITKNKKSNKKNAISNQDINREKMAIQKNLKKIENIKNK